MLLFGVTLVLSSCQKDDLNENEHNLKINEKAFKTSQVGKSIFKRNTKLNSLLSLLKENLEKKEFNEYNRTMNSSSYGFNINFNYAKFIESTDGTYHSYTFYIERDIVTDAFQNLVFSLKPDGEYELLLMTYSTTNQDKQDLLNGLDVDLSGKISSTLINEEGLVITDANRIEPCMGYILREFCGSGDHDSSTGYEGCIVYSSTREYFGCGGAVGGGSSSGDSPASPDNDGGMTSGGGSGGGANNDNGAPNELELPDNPCKENCSEIVTVPVVDEVQKATCQKMTDLKNDDVFKQKMVILKTAAEQWSFEKAFTVYDDPTPNTAINQSDNFDYDEFQGSASNPYIDWVGNSTIKGYIHSHFNGLLSIFSAHDLVDMYKTLLTSTVTDEFFYGVVTQSGTAYILQIDDRSSFIAFGNNYLSTVKKINSFINKQMINKYNVKETNSAEINELGFVKMLEDLDVGLNIYKSTDLTFSEYQKLEIVNNEVISNPCN